MKHFFFITSEFLGRFRKIKDKEAHFSLRNALIDHLWEKYPSGDS